MSETVSTSKEIIVGTHGDALYTVKVVPPDARALVIFFHGFGDHVGRYGRFFDYLASQGFAVAGFDQRGHGRSAGKRGDIKDFQSWVDDAKLVAAHARAAIGEDLPLVIIGHSVGGLVAIDYVSDATNDASAAVISAPALCLGVSLWQKAVGYLLSYVLPFLPVPSGIAPEQVSRDPEVIADYRESPLILRRLTLRTLRGMIRFGRSMRTRAEQVSCPVLMIQEENDEVCRSSATRAFFERVSVAIKRLIVYEGAYHEPLDDTIADTVFHDIVGWLDGVLRGGSGE